MATADDTLTILRSALDAGEWRPGARLPAERELAARLGAGRGTLRKALEALEAEGRIRRRVGQGTFVEDRAVAALRLPSAPTPADVMEVRLMLEPAVAAAAALRARDGDITALRRLAEPGAGGWRDWEQQDDAFHAAIAAASGNPLVTALVATLREMRSREDWSRLRRHSHTPERRRAFTHHHADLADAIARREPAAAAAAMRAHLQAVQAAMREEGPDLPPAPATAPTAPAA